MMCYLAGAIDMIQDRKDGDITKTWKTKAKKDLANNRISTIDPAATFNMASQITRYPNLDRFDEFVKDARKLYDINGYNMFASDVVLMRLGDEPTIGTPMELMMLAEYRSKALIDKSPFLVIWWDSNRPVPYYVGAMISKMNGKDFILVFNYTDAIESIKTYYNKIQE